MGRKLGTVLVLAAVFAVAWYMNFGDSQKASTPSAQPAAYRVPTTAEIDRMKAEKGMKASSAELKKMDSATVERVVDGDTVEVTLKGAKTKVRLLQVNTPETVDPRREVQEYGKEASNFTKSVLTKGTKVRLRYDVEREDKYGRLLAHIYLEDGTWFNALLIRAGFAQLATYAPNVSASEYFKALERKARDEKVGLWQIPENSSKK